MSSGTPKKLKASQYEDVYTIHKYPILAIPERGIDQLTAEKYEIRTKLHNDEDKVLAHYFPYYDATGRNVIGYKKRDLTKSKKESFSAVGDVSVKSPFFGNQTLGRDRTKLYVCEGEYDAACLHRLLTHYQKTKGKPEHADKQIHVVSIGAGTANAEEFCLNNMDTLQTYREVVLVFDNDKATPAEKMKGIIKGQDAVEIVALALHDLNIKYVKLPMKDVCEMYSAKRGLECCQQVLFNALEYSPESLITFEGGDEEVDFLSEALPKGKQVGFLPKLSSMMRGIRTHELTTLLAATGSGKSTLSKQVAFDLVKNHGIKVANFFLEEGVKNCMQDYIALYHGVRPAAFKQDPSMLTREQITEARDWMKENMMFYDCGHGNNLKPEAVARMVKHCAILGYEFLVFDHISYVISGADGGNERRMIDNMMTELASIARAYPIHIWLVAHIKRNDKYDKPKEKNEETGNMDVVYPHWMPVKKEDGRNSGAFEQISWNIVCLENQIVDEDGNKGDARLVLRKNRVWGDLGVCDLMHYDKTKGVLR